MSQQPNKMDDLDIRDMPPIGWLIAAGAFGYHILTNSPFGRGTDWVWWTITVLSVIAVVYVAWGLHRTFTADGAGAAVNWLFGDDRQQTDTKSPDEPEKTKPAPKKLKQELYFERADRRCEWCDERTDTQEIHHIKPRSKGGPNTRRNLIVLCPNCHRKADAGVMSRADLKYQVREQMEEYKP